MDHQTKVALKQDKFIDTTAHGLDWVSNNRSKVIRNSLIGAAVLVLAIVALVLWNYRSDAAETAFGEAMTVYQTPIADATRPVPPGTKTFPSSIERAKAASAAFASVADQYSLMKAGKNARYFAGITYLEAGQTQSAEDSLKKVASSWDAPLASLGKLALAQLYRKTSRDAQAIDLYNQLTAKPTDEVPAGLAQLQLADLYTSEGKVDQAHAIYAHLKDQDAKGAAGAIAAQKLNPSAAGQPRL